MKLSIASVLIVCFVGTSFGLMVNFTVKESEKVKKFNRENPEDQQPYPIVWVVISVMIGLLLLASLIYVTTKIPIKRKIYSNQVVGKFEAR
jgi:archaellum biogenesis protein FlaJ (TadC family)